MLWLSLLIFCIVLSKFFNILAIGFWLFIIKLFVLFKIFVIGFLFLYFQHINLSVNQKAMFVTGLLGALTTFSTFSWETLFLMQENLWTKAFINIGLNLFLSIGATFLGILVFKRVYGI